MNKGEMLSNAIVLATNKHAGQFDKGGQPYILHPLTVMSFLGADADEELRCIAVLHDVIEDTHTTYEELREAGMSKRVIDGVRALTKVPGETYDEYKEKVFANVDAMKAKKCDLQHNSDIRRIKERKITETDVRRIARYQAFYLEIEDRLAPKEVAPVAWYDPTNVDPAQSVTFSEGKQKQFPHLYPVPLVPKT